VWRFVRVSHANTCQAVYGTIDPWWEAVLLAHGVARVTTIEYNTLDIDHPLISTMTPAQYAENPVLFDAAISISRCPAVLHDQLLSL
jgi:hypothetical protein